MSSQPKATAGAAPLVSQTAKQGPVVTQKIGGKVGPVGTAPKQPTTVLGTPKQQVTLSATAKKYPKSLLKNQLPKRN